MCSLTGHSDCVYSVAFSPDSKRVVSGSVDNLVKIWDVETGAEVCSYLGCALFAAGFGLRDQQVQRRTWARACAESGLRSERTQGFTAGPVYGRARCSPMLGSLKTSRT